MIITSREYHENIRKMPTTIIELVQDFNNLVKDAISGPNCTDREICNGDCCFIHIKIPKILAEYYIEQNWAKKSDFRRGSRFSFEINVDLEELRCVFFSKEINGCKLHSSGMKAPQCWVYPTGLDPEDVQMTCKKADGWEIINVENIKIAKLLLDEYVSLCKLEAKKENSPKEIIKRLSAIPEKELDGIAPSSIAGVEDGWDKFHILIGEGYNLGVRYFCNEINCGLGYFECPTICDLVKQNIFKFLLEKLPNFIQINGFKHQYTFMELKKSM